MSVMRCCVCLVFCVSTTLSAQNWPAFRGVDRSGVADGQGLPTSWDLETGDNIRWKTDVPGLSHSSPIVWGEQIYLTTAKASSTSPEFIVGDVEVGGIRTASDLVTHQWSLYSIDRSTGRVQWSKVVHEGIPQLKRHVKSSHASQTPVTNGENILALFGTEGLFCFDMAGQLIWKVDVGRLDVGLWGDAEYQWGAASSPVIFDDLVIVLNDRQADSFLAAYRLSDGSEAWRVDRDEKPNWSTPLIYRGERVELVINAANFLYGYDPASGKELWRFSNNDSQVITPSPVRAGDRLILTGAYPTGSKPIYALNPGHNGRLAPSGRHLAWKVDRGSPYTPTPLFYKGLLYVIVDNGILSAYDVEDGERIYRTRLAVGAGFSASPVASDDRIYFSSEDGDVFVVRAGREFELLSSNAMGSPIMASPAISGKTLLIRAQSELVAIGER